MVRDHAMSCLANVESDRKGLRQRLGSMNYLVPQQHALPIHHESIRGTSDDSFYNDGQQTPWPENTLRRKTPNGTLNAGYDASMEDLRPPVKHQLVPQSESTQLKSHQPHITNSKRTYAQHQQDQQQRQIAALGGWSGQSGQDWQRGLFAPPPPASFPVMDSTLNQMPTHPFDAQQFYGQTVPSVIQPSFQHIGPTASGVQGAGPYGPYWHDGTYVPYRPTAIRDPRFYHHQAHPVQFPTTPTSSHVVQQNGVWHPQLLSPDHRTPTQGLYPFTLSGSQYFPSTGQTHPTLGFSLSSAALPVQNGHSSTIRHVPGQSESAVQQESPGANAHIGVHSSSGQRRDRIFAWALQQYRELLGFIQHTRRQQHNNRQAFGQSHSAPRPNFFPKPPRQSSGGSLFLGRQLRNDSPLRKQSGTDTQQSSLQADTPLEVAGHGGSTPKARSSSVWSPSGVHSLDSRASHDQESRVLRQHSHAQQADRLRTLRRSSGSTITPSLSPMYADETALGRAAVALEHITKACQETNWQWIDGMHLGGCLAYGLMNYQSAQKWYTKVLEIDPKHLEATSNLAAALLALGHKQEAEQNWMKVVTAAPNHFEAVEHLVGLLCNDQRSKEAVRVIEYVERSLRQPTNNDSLRVSDRQSECSSSASRSPGISDISDRTTYDFDAEEGISFDWGDSAISSEPGFGSSGFAIPGRDNGRILALIHAKGNMLYGQGDNSGAARAFEDAVLIAAGRKFNSIRALVLHILSVVSTDMQHRSHVQPDQVSLEPILLSPEQALATAKLCFPYAGELPGLRYVLGGPQSLARKAVLSTTSNSLLSLAKIYQDGMSNANCSAGMIPLAHGVRDILALYYLSLALQPSPSTANNVGILLAGVQQAASSNVTHQKVEIPGVLPGSGIALALKYYNYGLQLDQNHAHLYTNFGSLLKDIGQLDAAINMYERAVKCDGKFDIALANLANAVKDKGRVSDAIVHYKRAVEVNPEFAEAVCGLANALNSVCGWQGRGGIAEEMGKRARWHVDHMGMPVDARIATSSGWIKRVVDIVEKQLVDGETWGAGSLTTPVFEKLVQQMTILEGSIEEMKERERSLRKTLSQWSDKRWQGARITRLVERATRRISWHRYRDTFINQQTRTSSSYNRPQLPATLTVPATPTVLPFHTFTCPMSAKQIRQISQRNGLRISVSTLRAPWLPKQVYQPPKPPSPNLRVGYVSSDFNNHPLAHLMQSVFGLHDRSRVEAYCYATTASDNSVHRQQIQAEAPVFHDASSWTAERLVNQIVQDGIHILVNLNGYTRGARNEIFAARPAPIQMSFMGFAGTLGAEWCDYLLADETAVPLETLRPWRRNVDLEDQMCDESHGGNNNDWVYGENIIYCRDTFFCCDHKQSAPDAKEELVSWEDEQTRRWAMRKELFPQISDDTIIFGNFNQLYKIDPTTFRTWLRILAAVPNSILWLLRFPDLGESHLLATARLWAGMEVASRVVFTDVAPKHLHISRARICDLVIDTAECNAHTTAADVLWSGTPLLTLPRYSYKMCSRMAASILKGALPKNKDGEQAALELVAVSEEDYEEKAIALGKGFAYVPGGHGVANGRLMELRKMLYEARWSSALFDTKRWVRDLEDAYDEAWRRWVAGEGGDIFLRDLVTK